MEGQKRDVYQHDLGYVIVGPGMHEQCLKYLEAISRGIGEHSQTSKVLEPSFAEVAKDSYLQETIEDKQVIKAESEPLSKPGISPRFQQVVGMW